MNEPITLKTVILSRTNIVNFRAIEHFNCEYYFRMSNSTLFCLCKIRASLPLISEMGTFDGKESSTFDIEMQTILKQFSWVVISTLLCFVNKQTIKFSLKISSSFKMCTPFYWIHPCGGGATLFEFPLSNAHNVINAIHCINSKSKKRRKMWNRHKTNRKCVSNWIKSGSVSTSLPHTLRWFGER